MTQQPLSPEIVPDSRGYRHLACGEDTVVSGDSFEVVSNPMSSMERTMCVTCGAMFSITDFAWSDTGEKLSDYYARHTKNATSTQRLLCSKKFMVAIIVVSVILTEIGIYFLLADEEILIIAFCLVGGLMIGALIGMAIFVNLFAKPITRKVCGVSDTRLLK